MGRTISIETDVYIDLGDIETRDLIEELKTRTNQDAKQLINEIENYGRESFSENKKLLNHIKKCLGLREFHTKERIIQEILEL